MSYNPIWCSPIPEDWKVEYTIQAPSLVYFSGVSKFLHVSNSQKFLIKVHFKNVSVELTKTLVYFDGLLLNHNAKVTLYREHITCPSTLGT